VVLRVSAVSVQPLAEQGHADGEGQRRKQNGDNFMGVSFAARAARRNGFNGRVSLTDERG
jgi:hypothetical protein